ncbi:MAG: helix-turn-helix domain-containing protein [Mycobacteriales bacterium]
MADLVDVAWVVEFLPGAAEDSWYDAEVITSAIPATTTAARLFALVKIEPPDRIAFSWRAIPTGRIVDQQHIGQFPVNPTRVSLFGPPYAPGKDAVRTYDAVGCHPEGAMGRPERPIDPTEGSLQSFAWDLRLLRAKAGGMSYRQLAQRVEFSASALSAAASGTAVPSRQVTLAYVNACGGDPRDWERRWNELQASRAVRALTVDRPLCPPGGAGAEGPALAEPPVRWRRRAAAVGLATLLLVSLLDWLVDREDAMLSITVGVIAGLLSALGTELGWRGSAS